MGQSIPDPLAGARRGARPLRALAGSHPRDRGGVPDRRPRDARPASTASPSSRRAPTRTPLGEHTAGELISSEIEVKTGRCETFPEAARKLVEHRRAPARRGRRDGRRARAPAARTPGRRGGSRRSSTRPTTASSRTRCATSPGATTRSGSTSTSACATPTAPSRSTNAHALGAARPARAVGLVALVRGPLHAPALDAHAAVHAHVPALRHPRAVRRLGRLRPLRALAAWRPARSRSTPRSGGACARTSRTARSSCATPTRCADVRESLAVMAYAYALSARRLRAIDEGEPLPELRGRHIEENMWRAIRWGLSGELIDYERGMALGARRRAHARAAGRRRARDRGARARAVPRAARADARRAATPRSARSPRSRPARRSRSCSPSRCA